MDIIPEPFDREEQDKALVEALTATEAAGLYLDTSALVWLYRIRPKARAEFVNFLDAEPLRERSHIPMWSLHELNKHRKSPQVLFPLLDQHARLRNAIDLIQANAHLFVDDKFAGGTVWGTQEDYFKALADASAELLKVTHPLNKAGEIAQIDAELAPFFKAHALKQPLPALAGLRDEFVARCEGRLPPGYEDRGKGGVRAEATGHSGANRFGDFVFWRSVVDHARSDTAIKTVVIVSHDAKRDWIHVPDQYVGYSQKVAKNGAKGARYTCPQPILSFEINVEAGVERLFVVSIMQLVSAFSQQDAGGGFKELARAIQIEDAEAEEPAANSIAAVDEVEQVAEVDEPGAKGDDAIAAPVLEPIEEDGARPLEDVADRNEGLELPLAPQGLAARLVALPAAALADRNYQGDPQGRAETDQIITALRTHNWYVQNPAVLELPEAVIDPATSDLQRFILGRNLYQAACGNAWRAADFLPVLANQDAHYGGGNFAILFAGAVFETYFDPDGQLRANPKDQMIEIMLTLAAQPEFEAVTTWIHDLLAPAAEHFIVYPGGPRNEAVFEVAFDADGRPRELRVAGTRVTEPSEPDEDGWDPRALPARGTGERMIKTLAAAFNLPSTKIRIDPPIVDVLNFAGLRLRPWSTKSELIFPAD
ncbi:PIN-like domain-containing protein [Sphingomonas sp. SORGH_AS_0879]|uniref:PIN-like domain-containing protein n=1 Tax=Sphingomonas sp. SORGH_AS_0879 TaxID=3041790 RepID=UPI00277F4546|nr:PIN-like domain-containing protein [Sphingomonas sp. SORGH_AS_0879]MDQ1231467.1 hypothetical protein [Sphingomonas sp. SORGH_AS_0879]